MLAFGNDQSGVKHEKRASKFVNLFEILVVKEGET